MLKFEQLKDLKCGDQIIMSDPFFQEGVPYVLMSVCKEPSKEHKFFFKSNYGASLIIDSQETIDGFSVKIIDENHPSWDPLLSTYGKEIGEMLSKFEDDFKSL